MKVLITRPKDSSDSLVEALKAIGAEPILFPTIEIATPEDYASLDDAIRHASDYAWVVFTSANAVKSFCERAEVIDIIPKFNKVAAVGPKTAKKLKKRGVIPDFVPEEFTGDAIPAGMGDLTGEQILLPLADIAPDDLEAQIKALGGIPDRVTAYQTDPAVPEVKGVSAIQTGVDVITFASPSAARNFAKMVRYLGLNPFDLPGTPKIVCIGPKTAKVARAIGYEITATAEEYTVEGIVEEIKKMDPDQKIKGQKPQDG